MKIKNILQKIFKKFLIFQVITTPFSMLNERISRVVKVPHYLSDKVRYVIACLLSMGFAISFGLRCNLGVAIVDVTNNSTVTEHGKEYEKVSWGPPTSMRAA